MTTIQRSEANDMGGRSPKEYNALTSMWSGCDMERSWQVT
jgi:hypothetical protein